MAVLLAVLHSGKGTFAANSFDPRELLLLLTGISIGRLTERDRFSADFRKIKNKILEKLNVLESQKC